MSKRYIFTTFVFFLSFVSFNPAFSSAELPKKNVLYVSVDQNGQVTVDQQQDKTPVMELAMAPSALTKSAVPVVETSVPPNETKKAMSVKIDAAGNVSVEGEPSAALVEGEKVTETKAVEENSIPNIEEPAKVEEESPAKVEEPVAQNDETAEKAPDLKEAAGLTDEPSLLDEPFVSKDEPTNEVTETLENKSSYSMDHYNDDLMRDKYSDEPFYRDNEKEGLLTQLFDRNNHLVDIEFGEDSYYYEYKEPGFMRDHGLLYGLYSSITYRTSKNRHVKSFSDAYFDKEKGNMFRLEVRGSMGQVDYESPGSGTLNDEDYYTFEGRGLYGYDFPIMANSRLTPYAGLGWRYLKDDSGGRLTSVGDWTYDRESQYFYAPVGAEFATSLTKKWDMALSLEYDFFIEGKQKSHLEDGGISVCDINDNCYALDNLINKQKKGYGVRGSLKLRRLGENFDLVIEPFVRFWKIEDSQFKQLSSENGSIVWVDADTNSPIYGYEPHNQTTEAGLKVGINY